MEKSKKRCDVCNQRGVHCQVKKAGAIKLVCAKCANELKNKGWIKLDQPND